MITHVLSPNKWYLVTLTVTSLLLLTNCTGTSTITQTAPPNKENTTTLETTITVMATEGAQPTATSEVDSVSLPPELMVYSNEPILTSEAAGEWAIDVRPIGVAFHEGEFYMFYSGQSTDHSGIGYATSPDGYTWEVMTADAPLFTLQDVSSTSSGTILDAALLIEDDGTWVMYMMTRVTDTPTIRRATAHLPTGPWTAAPEPVLTPGNAGVWDARSISEPDVLKVENSYVMYYTGQHSGNLGAIGLATSPDGITWTKYDDPTTMEVRLAESDPILRHESATDEQVAEYFFRSPSVWPTANGWSMFYSITPNGNIDGESGFGYATSPDGVTWQPFAENPILTVGDNDIAAATLLQHDGTCFLYYALTPDGYQMDIYLATFESQTQ